jgi:hypothetical protein
MRFLLLTVFCVAAAFAAAPTFDKATSYRYVYYAYAAYNQPAVGTWKCPYCTNYTTGFNVTKGCSDLVAGSYAYVGYNPNYKEIVASFRGSSDLANWIEDIDAIHTPPGKAFPGIPNAQVEEGFYDYYESLKDCVVGEMKSLQSKYAGYTLAVTGHSLGAAGAAFAAMDMRVNLGFATTPRCLNFGEPRLGNKAFYQAALQYMPELQRMVDYEDCVPKLPLESFGYQHEAYEIYEHPTGADTYKVCDDSGEDKTCSDSVGSNCDDHLHYMGVQCCDKP